MSALKVVLITGAGSGIGKSTALRFANDDTRLSIADINSITLNETALSCKEINQNGLLQTTVDVTKDDEIQKLIDDTVKSFGRIDVIVNCAGIFRSSRITDADIMKVYDEVFNLNVRSVVAMITYAAKKLIESKGCIINMSSTASIIVTDNTVAYSTSKAVLTHLSKCIALELAPYGVRVNSVVPGPARTNIFINAGLSESENNAFVKLTEDCLPLRHIVEPSDIAEIVAYLASDKARSMTGGGYVIDSGILLSGFDSFDN